MDGSSKNMNPTHGCIASFTFLLWLGAALRPNADVVSLPSVLSYSGPERLTGRVIILASNNSMGGATNTSPPTIYSLDLAADRLKHVSTAPQFGPLNLSQDGHLYCVRASDGSPEHAAAFVYSDRSRTAQQVPLRGIVSADAFVGNHLLFALHETNGLRLLDHDMTMGGEKVIHIPRAEKEHWEFGELRALGEHTNLLFFTCKAATAQDAHATTTNACFSYDVESGQISFVNATGTLPSYKDTAGRYVFFLGPAGPAEGIELVSSSVDYPALAAADVRTKDQLRRIQRFPRPRQGNYRLLQLSPCRRYALLRLDELVPPGAYVHNYLVVNLSTSRTWTLLRNESALYNGTRVWPQIYWVPGSNGPRSSS